MPASILKTYIGNSYRFSAALLIPAAAAGAIALLGGTTGPLFGPLLMPAAGALIGLVLNGFMPDDSDDAHAAIWVAIGQLSGFALLIPATLAAIAPAFASQ